MMLLLDAVRAHKRAEHIAIVEFSAHGRQTASINYHTLMIRANAIAAAIHERTAHDATVILALPNGIDFCAAFLGVVLSGRTVFPMQAHTSDMEMTQFALASHASLVIAQEGHEFSLPVLDASMCDGTAPFPSPPRPPALILQTSGTTGQPKLVLRESPSLDAVARTIVQRLAITASDQVLIVIPMAHSYGIEHGVLAPLLAGATICVLDGTMPAVINRVLWEQHITIVPGVPVLFESLARNAPTREHTLRLVYSAGSRLVHTIAHEFFDTWGLHIGQIYGSSDVGSVVYSDPHSPQFDNTAVGLPLDDVSIRILSRHDSKTTMPVGEEGIVAIRAPSMLSRYVTDHSLDLIDGHLLTDDLGSLDHEGRLHLAGRLSLVLDVGGKKVNPEEVEEVLRQHPGVKDCAVTSLPISGSVSRLRAVIVPSTPIMPPSAGDLRSFARARLQPHKVPRSFVLVESLPRSSIGKILRNEIA